MPKQKKCNVCTMSRPISEFKRKNKMYKSCNKCSEYKQRYSKSRKSVDPPTILKNIFEKGSGLPPQFYKQYQQIKILEHKLINEIHEYYNNQQVGSVDQ